MIVPHIHRVSIEGFRRIQAPLELDLVAPKGEPSSMVVMAGPNGCGKTTVLEAILLGLGMESLIVRDLEKSRREQHWRVTLDPGARIELDVSLDHAPPQTWVRTASAHVVQSVTGWEEPLALPKALAVELFSSWRARRCSVAVVMLLMVGHSVNGGTPTERPFDATTCTRAPSRNHTHFRHRCRASKGRRWRAGPLMRSSGRS